MFGFKINDNQEQKQGIEIIDKAIYVHKEIHQDFKQAVIDKKWINLLGITGNMFGEYPSIVILRIKKIRKEKERENDIKYIIDGNLSEGSNGMCSAYNVYFRAEKSYIDYLK